MESITNEYKKTILEIKVQTLQDAAAEIHDNIGSTLSYAKLNLIAIDWNKEQNTRVLVTQALEHLSHAIEEMRQLTRAFNTNYINETGLINTLGQELAKIGRTRVINTAFDFTGTPKYLEKQVEVIVFRVIQEALNNSIKHANPSYIKLWLHYENDKMTIELVDDGKGFDVQHVLSDNLNGTGLLNIKKRIALINGNWQLISRPGEGTTLKITIPC